MSGVEFERKLRRILKAHFGESAYVKRIIQDRWTRQHIDIEVDSRYKKWYMGIECKSAEIKRGDPIGFYFSSHFKEDQFDNITDFLTRSGRRGFLALQVNHYYLNRGSKSKSTNHPMYIIKWRELLRLKRKGEKAVWLDEVKHKQLKKVDAREFNVVAAFS